VNYTRWTIVFLVASVPLVIHLANRRSASPREVVRFATFDLALLDDGHGAPARVLSGGGDERARRLAAVVQHAQPDVLLLCGLDRYDIGPAVHAFTTEYLAVPQHGRRAIEYRWRHTSAPIADPGSRPPAEDAPRRGMALLSRHPILTDRVRTFERLAWSAMPGALRPDGSADAAWAERPLSSAGHWDLPLGIGDPAAGGRVVHVLCSFPEPVGTGRAGDARGNEDGAARRNHDETRFWTEYLSPGADWITDDAGVRGGLAADAAFVVLGTFGVDPVDGAGRHGALEALLAHTRVHDPRPRSAGADEAAKRQFGANSVHAGDPALDTADLDDTAGTGPGNLRLDYALPARSLTVAGAGVFWPAAREPGAELLGASAHRAVWVDVALR
jgi:hypothetical protein